MADLKYKIRDIMGDNLMVRVLLADKVTKGGIIKPQNYREDDSYAQVEAEVLLLGETANCQALDKFPAIGDVVLMTRYAGKEFTEPDGQECRIIQGEDILATLEVDHG